MSLDDLFSDQEPQSGTLPAFGREEIIKDPLLCIPWNSGTVIFNF